MSMTEQQIVRAAVVARQARNAGKATGISPTSRSTWVSAGLFTAFLAATVVAVTVAGR